MTGLLSIFLLSLFPAGLSGQTVIDLKRGGGVRAKTVDDYRRDDSGLNRRVREDSIAYNDCLTRAFNALYRDSLDQAEELLARALTLRPAAPSNYIVRHYLARIHMARGQYAEAVKGLTTLLRERPEDREVRGERASCYIESGNAQAALEDCNALLASPPSEADHVHALFLRTAAYHALHETDKALADTRAVLQLDLSNKSAHLLQATLLAEMGQTAEAMNRYNLYVTAHREDADGYAARAELEVRQEMWQAARADYDEALRIRPADPTLLLARATVLERLGLNALAKRDREAAKGE